MIISGGILAQMLYNLLSSILRAIGNSKIPLYFLIISALLNILLDLLFIVLQLNIGLVDYAPEFVRVYGGCETENHTALYKSSHTVGCPFASELQRASKFRGGLPGIIIECV